jgi:hypothetical protein
LAYFLAYAVLCNKISAGFNTVVGQKRASRSVAKILSEAELARRSRRTYLLNVKIGKINIPTALLGIVKSAQALFLFFHFSEKFFYSLWAMDLHAFRRLPKTVFLVKSAQVRAIGWRDLVVSRRAFRPNLAPQFIAWVTLK